jgi:predicted small secreted protein
MNRLRIIANLIVLAAISLMLIGCHTAEGFGKDVESTGEAIQEEAVKD